MKTMHKRIVSTMVILTMIFSVMMSGQTVFAAGEQAVLDKECTNAVSSFGVWPDRKICQIFTPGFSGTMDRISLYMHNGYCDNAGQMTLTLKNTDGSGNPTGEALATTGFAYAAKTNAWYEAVFQNKPLLSDTKQYALILEGKGTDSSKPDYILQTGYNTNMGGNLTATGVNLGANASLDYRTYMFRAAAPVVPVPPRNPATKLDKSCTGSFMSFGIFKGDVVHQTFTAGKTGLLDEMELFVSNEGQDINGEITVEVSNVADATGKVLASTSFEYNKNVSSWYRAVFKQKPSVIAGQQYTLNFKTKTFGTMSSSPDFMWAMETGIVNNVGGRLTVTDRPLRENQSVWFKTYVLEGYSMPAAPAGLNGIAVTGIANNDGEILGVTTEMEYKLAADAAWTMAKSSEVSGLASGTYSVRYTAKPGSLAGAEAEVSIGAFIPPTPAAPTGISGTAVTVAADNDGKILGVTPEMEYKRTSDSPWIAVTATEVSGLAAGNYSLRYAAKPGNLAGLEAEVTVGAYVPPAVAAFRDVTADKWYYDAVQFVAIKGIAAGTGEGLFGPDGKLTRGQFMVMVMKAYGIKPDDQSTDNFADAGNVYYTGYLATSKRMALSSGVGNNKFAPDMEITREEMFTLLYNTLKQLEKLPTTISGKTLADFSDSAKTASWSKDAMAVMVGSGVVSGNGGKLNPTGSTSRAEMAQILYKLLSK